MDKLNSSKSVFCSFSCQKIIPLPPQVSTTKLLHVTLLQFTIRKWYMQKLKIRTTNTAVTEKISNAFSFCKLQIVGFLHGHHKTYTFRVYAL